MRSSGPVFDDCLRTRGVILSSLAPGLYQASLPNGKPVVAHLSKELANESLELSTGSVVLLELSPFDLDRARIARIGLS